MNTKERHLEIINTAKSLIETHKINIGNPVAILPLAKEVVTLTGCHINTAKRNVAKAVRLMRGELVSQWGGTREGGGRPKKE